MRSFVFLTALALLPSCIVTKGIATENKPSRKSLIGSYSTERVAWLAAQRGDLKHVSIDLAANGSFKIRDRSPRLSGIPLLPRGNGTWGLVLTSGIEINSNESWGVNFTSTDGSQLRAFCLNENAPYELIFTDESKRGLFGETLILHKTR